jgi:hypothetical protein
MLIVQRCYACGAYHGAVFGYGFGYRQLPNAPMLARVSVI